MENMTDSDAETAAKIKRMMVVWEDLAIVTDRSLQEALRSVDSRRLALSLIKADPRLVVQYRGAVEDRRAREAIGEERDRLFEKMDSTFSNFGAYQARATNRKIPVMVLERVEA